jgi:hypothetical protein
MCIAGLLWLLQGIAYFNRGDWGHAVMGFAYSVATLGLVYAWFWP